MVTVAAFTYVPISPKTLTVNISLPSAKFWITIAIMMHSIIQVANVTQPFIDLHAGTRVHLIIYVSPSSANPGGV